MYGDFSQGHGPDRARGRNYRRVLLQQGRPVLDSDAAAEVDALLEAVRDTTRTLGCRAGSSDLGFLVTPGRLVTIFSRVRRDLQITEGAPNVWVDFRFRYAGRYPALYLGAPAGQVRVQVPATQSLVVDSSGTELTLWAHVESPTTITVNGVSFLLAPQGSGPAPYTFSVPSTTLGPIELELDTGEVWLYLLEEHQPAGHLGTFAVAPGTFQVDGMVATTGGGAFPDLAYPHADGFGWDDSPPSLPLGGLTAAPAAGDRVVAYLEVWERVVTAVEDPGIREVALGTIDTSVRTQLMAQVKLAPLSNAVPADKAARDAQAAFDAVEVSGGELFLKVPTGSTAPDPCALPTSEGYSGDDNRLYRIQVHRGGSLSQVTFTWSRDNANELFAATLSASPSRELVLDASTALAAGDLVEVLSSVVDLGDDQLGSVSAGAFVPPDRAVGQLGQLVELPSQAGDDSVRFRLADVNNANVTVALDNRYGDPSAAGLKLRRWHGVLDPQRLAGRAVVNPSASYVLEDGITVSLSSSGTYRPGQYWQYQARTGVTPAEPWRSAPHGPERWFAPLALLRLPDASPPGTDVPWELVAWLDERFDHLCDLQADDIAFDGGRVPTQSDTVQEALEELYSRHPAAPVWPRISRITWHNDQPLAMANFNSGLQVTFSEEMHPATATTSAFVVTLEVPQDGNPSITIPHIIDGTVNVSGRNWTFVPHAVDGVQLASWEKALGHGVRCRVRLVGDVILDRAGERPLDGDTIGFVSTGGYDTWVDLRLPSGDGQRGGDFESWFFLHGPPPLVRVESVTPGRAAVLNQPPAAIMVSFTNPVQFDTLTPDSLQVLVGVWKQQVGDTPVTGKIQPYPFEANPQLVSRVTFVPDYPAAFQVFVDRLSGAVLARVVTINVKGTGDHAVLDAGGRAIDAAGAGTASDFSSTFTVAGPRPLVRVASVSPERGAHFASNAAPGAIIVSFTDQVRFGTLTRDSLQVLTNRAQSPVLDTVDGNIQPDPFEVNPQLVSRVTFVPRDPAAFQAFILIGVAAPDRVVTINVKGTGDHAVLDAAGRAIDAAGAGTASDFSSTFTVAGLPPLVQVESVSLDMGGGTTVLLSPGQDTHLASDAAPGAIMVSFTDQVRFDTVTPDSLQVLTNRAQAPGLDTVLGHIQPDPFEVNPQLVSRVRFVPSDLADFQVFFLFGGVRVVTINVKGTGDRAVLDAGGRAIDAAGTGTASDFSWTFTVGQQP